MREGRFREDLYHRLNVIHLQLPPLRERREDVPLLLEHFLERFCTENEKPLRQFTPGAMKLLMDYDWPGNVRELENVVERAVVLSTQERVDADLLPESIRSKEIVRGRSAAALRIPAAAAGRAGLAGRRGPSTSFAVSDHGRNRAAHHHGHAGTHGLESDGSRGTIP